VVFAWQATKHGLNCTYPKALFDAKNHVACIIKPPQATLELYHKWKHYPSEPCLEGHVNQHGADVEFHLMHNKKAISTLIACNVCESLLWWLVGLPTPLDFTLSCKKLRIQAPTLGCGTVEPFNSGHPKPLSNGQWNSPMDECNL
jgi:hypothetical protein